MNLSIVKRDGSLQLFDEALIVSAVKKAAESCGINLSKNLPRLISDIVLKVQATGGQLSVVLVQEIVESHLMVTYPAVGKAYSDYRMMRDRQREAGSKLLKEINGLITQKDTELTKENANKAASCVTSHRDLLAGILSKHFAKNVWLPEEVRESIADNKIWMHDLDYLVSVPSGLTNCCLINYRGMLEKGFSLSNAKIETPRSIGVAANVTSQICQAVASSQYGGMTLAHIDTGLAPYVAATHRKLLDKQAAYGLSDAFVEDELQLQVYDAMQTLYYQINSLVATSGQTPFLTLSLGYDTTKYGQMVTEAYLRVHTKGLGVKEKTSVFPKLIFFLQNGVNMKEGDPNYYLKKLAMDCAVKRIYPDFISVPLIREITGCETPVTSMGCRSFLGKFVDKEGKEVLDGRCNLGVVTINPVQAANEVGTGAKLEDYLTKLDEYLEIAYRAQMYRIGLLAQAKAKSNPVLFCEGAISRLDPEDNLHSIIYGGYASASIGFVGLYDALHYLYGEYDKHTALTVVKFMNAKVKEFKERSNISFSLYGTPAESLAGRWACTSQDPECKFLTNSFHYPCFDDISISNKFNFERGFAEQVSGGFIGYVETPNLRNNKKALESIIDYAYYRIPYFGINQPVDHCYACDNDIDVIIQDDEFSCPVCGNGDASLLSIQKRVSGYIGEPSVRGFNAGKQAEMQARVKHSN